jgi:hypothetical protein
MTPFVLLKPWWFHPHRGFFIADLLLIYCSPKTGNFCRFLFLLKILLDMIRHVAILLLPSSEHKVNVQNCYTDTLE